MRRRVIWGPWFRFRSGFGFGLGSGSGLGLSQSEDWSQAVPAVQVLVSSGGEDAQSSARIRLCQFLFVEIFPRVTPDGRHAVSHGVPAVFQSLNSES